MAQNWETFHLDLADAFIEHSVIIAKEGGSPVVLAPEKMGALKIDFKTIKLDRSEYVMQCYPSAMLPKQPSGRLAFVGELIDRQMVSPEEGLSLLEFPDVSSVIENKTAYIDDIKYNGLSHYE